MIHNLILGLSPHPEKFWINFETQNLLGGVKFLGDINQTLEFKFEDLLRTPYDYEDPAVVFEVKMLRYMVDSNLSKYVDLNTIDKIVIHKVYDPSTFEFEYDRYWLFFPSTNALAIDKDLPADKRIFETNPIFIAIVFK